MSTMTQTSSGQEVSATQVAATRHAITPSQDAMVLATVVVIYLFPASFLLLLLIFSALPQHTGKHLGVAVFYRQLSLPEEVSNLAKLTGITITLGSALRLLSFAGLIALSGVGMPASTWLLLIVTAIGFTLGALTWKRKTCQYAYLLALIFLPLLCADLYAKATVGQNAGVMLFSLLAAYLSLRLAFAAEAQDRKATATECK